LLYWFGKLWKQTANKDHQSDEAQERSDHLNLSSHDDLGDDSGKDPGCHGQWSEELEELALEMPLAMKTN